MRRNRTPAHWVTVTFDRFVSAIEAGKSFRCIEKPPDDDVPGVVKISAVTWGRFDEQESKTCPDDKQFDPKLQVRTGDFLISRANTIELVGACVLVGSVTKRLMLSDKVLRLVMPEEMKRWSLWFLRSKEGRAQIEARATGNQLSMRNIGQAGLLGIEVPVPPCNEQRGIVAAVESCFTRLDDAEATLSRVQRNLQRYRASVLKAAVEGRLVPTEAELARAEGRDYKPASMLLERAAAARKEAVWKSLAEQKLLDGELPGVPEGWCWTTVGALLVYGPQNGLYVPRAQYGTGTPILRIDDYQSDWSRPAADLHRVAIPEDDSARYGLRLGDLVVNRVNSPSHLGKTLAVGESHVGVAFESNMMRLQLAPGVSPWFVQYYLSSITGKRRLTGNAKWAVNQASINQGDLIATVVPLPPAREQQRIVAEVDRLLTAASATSAGSQKTIRRCSLLRQSILRRAFEGRLVDQDANDEPVSVLLERIRAERQPVSSTTARPRGRRRKTAATPA